MIILVQASIILVTRMISTKTNMILRAWPGGNFQHPIIILVFPSWQRRVGLSIFGRGGRVRAGSGLYLRDRTGVGPWRAWHRAGGYVHGESGIDGP